MIDIESQPIGRRRFVMIGLVAAALVVLLGSEARAEDAAVVDLGIETKAVTQLLLLQPVASIDGTVTDRHTGETVGGICVDASPFGDPDTVTAGTVTGADGTFSIVVPPGTYQVSYIDCLRWDYAAEWYGTDTIEPVDATSGDADASFALTTGAMSGLVDVRTGLGL